MAAALAAPLHHLADLRLPPGLGDKRVLRACLLRLGLPRAAARAKRAIQVGGWVALGIERAGVLLLGCWTQRERRCPLTRPPVRPQFGTRLAAKTNTQQFGGTRRANLLNAGSVRLADVGQQPGPPV